MTTSITEHEGKKYLREIHSAVTPSEMCLIDVYSVIEAFGVTCPARAHAIKKLLCAGSRGRGSVENDLHGVIAAVNRAIELEEMRE